MKESRVHTYGEWKDDKPEKLRKLFFEGKSAITKKQLDKIADETAAVVLQHVALAKKGGQPIEHTVITLLDNSHLLRKITNTRQDNIALAIENEERPLLSAMEKIRHAVLERLRNHLPQDAFSIVEHAISGADVARTVVELHNEKVAKIGQSHNPENLLRLKALPSHPGILFVTETVDATNKIQIMQHMPKHTTLYHKIFDFDREDDAALPYIFSIYHQIITAEIFLKNHGLLCGDIDPQNIALYQDDQGKEHAALFDWDCLHATDEPVFSYAGKQGFVPPERWAERDICVEPIDEFDIVYELATGLNAALARFHQPQPSDTFIVILRRALTAPRNTRPTLRELNDALLHALPNTIITPTPPPSY